MVRGCITPNWTCKESQGIRQWTGKFINCAIPIITNNPFFKLKLLVEKLALPPNQDLMKGF